MLSLVESNLKLVKLFAQHGSTFPLFHSQPCMAQHVEPTHAQCPAFTKIAMVHSHHFLVAHSVLDHELFHYVVGASFTASTPSHALVLRRRFFAFLSLSMSYLTRSAAKHFRGLRG